MRWFAARILSEAVHRDDPAPESLFEERIILLRAQNEGEAMRRAGEIGAGSVHEYQNAFGKAVRWEFRDVLEVQEVLDDQIVDGTEVYYAFLGEREARERRSALTGREPEAARS